MERERFRPSEVCSVKVHPLTRRPDRSDLISDSSLSTYSTDLPLASISRDVLGWPSFISLIALLGLKSGCALGVLSFVWAVEVKVFALGTLRLRSGHHLSGEPGRGPSRLYAAWDLHLGHLTLPTAKAGGFLLHRTPPCRSETAPDLHALHKLLPCAPRPNYASGPLA